MVESGTEKEEMDTEGDITRKRKEKSSVNEFDTCGAISTSHNIGQKQKKKK